MRLSPSSGVDRRGRPADDGRAVFKAQLADNLKASSHRLDRSFSSIVVLESETPFVDIIDIDGEGLALKAGLWR